MNGPSKPSFRIAPLAAALALIAVVAAGCAGQAQPNAATSVPVTGDSRGGSIPHGVDDPQAGMKSAVEHCAQFGKKAQLTRMDAPSQGGLMAFECR